MAGRGHRTRTGTTATSDAFPDEDCKRMQRQNQKAKQQRMDHDFPSNARLQIIEEKLDILCRMVHQLTEHQRQLPDTPTSSLSVRVTESLILSLSKELGYHWRNVGRQLGVNNSTIEEITYRYPTSLQEQAYQCLWIWLRNDGSHHGLHQALLAEGLSNLIEQFLV